MGFHEYSTIWIPQENEVLHARKEPTNKKDKFAVAVIVHKNSVASYLMKGKSGRFAKLFPTFYGQTSIMGAGVVLLAKLSIKEMIKA